MPNIQEKKLNVIEQLIIINDEKSYYKVEKFINQSLQRPKPKRFTKRQLLKRATTANKDIENGDFVSQDKVEKLSGNGRMKVFWTKFAFNSLKENISITKKMSARWLQII